jgi:hypothetical protein
MADGVVKPMRLDTSLLDGISAANAAAKSSSKHAQKSSGSSFSSALKAATSTDSSSQSDDKTAATDAAETTRAVPGHLYAEILTGPRAGMYVNTSHNVRAGQTFVMVHRNGVELHVYGTGKNRHVVEMRRHSDPATGGSSSKTTTDKPTASTPTTATTPSGTTTTAGKIVTDTSTIN